MRVHCEKELLIVAVKDIMDTDFVSVDPEMSLQEADGRLWRRAICGFSYPGGACAC